MMQRHQVRRLPVIDGHNLVGMLSQADTARHADEHRTAPPRRDGLGNFRALTACRASSRWPPPCRRRPLRISCGKPG
ncbi:hypothetical protein [Glutamicibacter protophormiae]|uniref:hypothetical protein n=1 Tax=Glutamicibacter protophormiae TaxID=37930 RepID=UPI0035AB8B8A